MTTVSFAPLHCSVIRSSNGLRLGFSLLCLMLLSMFSLQSARAATCTISNFQVTFGNGSPDAITWYLEATIDGGNGSLEERLECIVEEYYDANGNVISTPNAVYSVFGQTSSMNVSHSAGVNINGSDYCKNNAPAGAVKAKYYYKLRASVKNISGTQVAYDIKDSSKHTYQWVTSGGTGGGGS